MKAFLRSMNFARWSILFSLLGTLALLWLGLWQRSLLAEMQDGLSGGASKVSQQIAQLARKHTQLSENLKGENLQGEADMQSYIYRVAGTDRVDAGNVLLNTPAPEQFSKGIVDKKTNIRPDNRERTFARTVIANFLYKLEEQSRRVKVTMITIENADRRVKNHEIPKDQWTFIADITSRQRSE